MSSRRKSRTSAAVALGVIALTAFAGCGDSDDSEGGAEPVGQELGGSTAQLALCSDWTTASDAEKLATIDEIRSQVNREDAGVTASALSDERAMEVFDNGCDDPAAGGLRLNVMYARAAAFEPLRKVADGEEP